MVYEKVVCTGPYVVKSSIPIQEVEYTLPFMQFMFEQFRESFYAMRESYQQLVNTLMMQNDQLSCRLIRSDIPIWQILQISVTYES